MERHILFRCPHTGLHVQHWLVDDASEDDSEYQSVTCPACTRFHFVHKETGKLLGHQDK